MKKKQETRDERRLRLFKAGNSPEVIARHELCPPDKLTSRRYEVEAVIRKALNEKRKKRK